jgi:lysophospholipase L1-like esterase
MPVISRGKPAFASGSSYPVANAVDADYSTNWRSSGAAPVWIAVDLSSVPVAQRHAVVVAWSNDLNFNYDLGVFNDTAYNLPGDYTIDVNAAPGGSVPTSGWGTVATVVGNKRHSRQHLVQLTSGATTYNWIRMRATSFFGSSGNSDLYLQLDVHDAHLGLADDWIFYGDSITAGCWDPGAFAELVRAAKSGNFPLAENGGIGFFTAENPLQTNAATGQPWFDGWLADFPGRYVGLSYGTNDSSGNFGQAEQDLFYSRMSQLVQKVVAAGKVPVIPVSIPWSTLSGIQANGAAVRTVLAKLRADHPQIVAGPDLWTVFLDHPEWLRDGLHPNDAGNVQMRQAWVQAMLATVYAATP